MNKNNFKAAYSLANTLYGIVMDESTFEDIALQGWLLIGNKQTCLHKYRASVEDGKVLLPCNVDYIEAVFSNHTDASKTTSLGENVINKFIEEYVESYNKHNHPFYVSGHLVNYRVEGDYLLLESNHSSVTILYHGIITDSEGLPYLTDKELQAIAAYVAYADTYKKSLVMRDGNLMQLANVLKADWLRFCNSARIPEHLSQNDINSVLDVKTRWDRKSYGNSLQVLK